MLSICHQPQTWRMADRPTSQQVPPMPQCHQCSSAQHIPVFFNTSILVHVFFSTRDEQNHSRTLSGTVQHYNIFGRCMALLQQCQQEATFLQEARAARQVKHSLLYLQL